MISDISYCRVPTDWSVLWTSHAIFGWGSCQKVFGHEVLFFFCSRRSSSQWKKNTRLWVFHDFLSFSLFDFPSVLHFCWAAGPARRREEKLWGGWGFTFKDAYFKYWTKLVHQRAHHSCYTTVVPHIENQFPGTNWKHDNNARGELFDDCWIMTLSLWVE